MTAPAKRRTTLRSREVIADLAAAEADDLRRVIRHPEQPGAWDHACRLLHGDPEVAAATLLALAAMVPYDTHTDVLLARVDAACAPPPRRT